MYLYPWWENLDGAQGGTATVSPLEALKVGGMAKTKVNVGRMEGGQAGAAEGGVLQSLSLLQPRSRGKEMLPRSRSNRHCRRYGRLVDRGEVLKVLELTAGDLSSVCHNGVRRTCGASEGGTPRAGAPGLGGAQ